MTIASLLATKGPNVVTIRADATIRQALAQLASHNIGAIVVVNEAGWPVGIISERDVVRSLVRDENILPRSVASIMTRDVILGTPQDDLMAVGITMTERRIRHLPVVDGRQLVGIVSIGDVVKAQRDRYQGEVDTLQIQILREQV
jgi:CBS domain-containing protein